MTERVPCPAAPGPLEAYTAQFDLLFGTLAQRRGFREYLQGLLLPRDRNKTLTALVGAEPVVAAQAGAVQRLQFFLSESVWDAEAINSRRLALLLSDPAMVPHVEGVLVIDDTGDRKAGTHIDRNEGRVAQLQPTGIFTGGHMRRYNVHLAHLTEVPYGNSDSIRLNHRRVAILE
jgi:hypothetical protein